MILMVRIPLHVKLTNMQKQIYSIKRKRSPVDTDDLYIILYLLAIQG